MGDHTWGSPLVILYDSNPHVSWPEIHICRSRVMTWALLEKQSTAIHWIVVHYLNLLDVYIVYCSSALQSIISLHFDA